MTDANSTQSVVLERALEAPIDLVWRMWTDPDHFAAWYGPQGASIPVAEMDVRVGGARLICMEMQTPDGRMRMWFAGEYVDVDAPQRLVYTEAMSDENGNATSPYTQVTVELADRGGSTAMTMTHDGVPADSPGAMGWEMALDKLETHIAGQS